MTRKQDSQPHTIEKAVPSRQDISILLISAIYQEVKDWLVKELEEDWHINWLSQPLINFEEKLATIPDIIICDMALMEESVADIAVLLKEGIQISHVPVVIMVSINSMDGDKLRDEAADSWAQIMHRNDLLKTIKSLLNTIREQHKVFANGFDSKGLDDGGRVYSGDPFLEVLTGIILKQVDNSELSVEQICMEMRMSESALYRKLKTLTGLSLVPFIRNIRLNKAKQLLTKTSMSLTDIAFAVGFSDSKFFSKVFLQVFGVRAIDYRKQHNLSLKNRNKE